MPDNSLDGGTAGRDTLVGGAGFDTASFAERSSSVAVDLSAGLEGNSLTAIAGVEGVLGSRFGDALTGDAAANWLHGAGGDDALDGGGGADTLVGGAGDDLLEGGEGFDVASYVGAPGGVSVDLGAGTGSGWGGDTLSGVEGVIGTAFDDALAGDAQDNWLDGGTAGRDTLIGGAGFDTASFASRGASVAVDLAAGLEGNSLTALSGVEGVLGTALGDAMVGDSGANWLHGGGGDDALDGAEGADTLLGGAGDDLLAGSDGFDLASYAGGPGPVSVDLGAGTATGWGSDTLSGVEGVVGTAFGDALTGDSGANWLEGDFGDDTLAGGAGSDTLLGGAGSNTLDGGDGLLDFASYATAGGAVTVDLSAGTTAGWATDSLTSIEWVAGSAFGDSLAGDGGDNGLVGGAGNDLLDAGDGNDTLDGGADVDNLTGGAGFDVFVFNAGQAGGDTVTDFDGLGAGAGDVLLFVGYGTLAAGASFSEVGGGFWQITSADGSITETIALSNLAAVDSSDVIFA